AHICDVVPPVTEHRSRQRHPRMQGVGMAVVGRYVNGRQRSDRAPTFLSLFSANANALAER
ncbi:hypothetical protein C6A70_26250, partial [Escherichia coli]